MKEKLLSYLTELYGNDHALELTQKIISKIEITNQSTPHKESRQWSQKDLFCITYGNTIINEIEAPLKVLQRFLKHYFKDIISVIHILPFYPYSSDDGFAVIDYRQVNPKNGDWDDIKNLSENFQLMFDFVLNHVSRESLWFNDFINNVKPACDYFIEIETNPNLSQVVRPRSSPLLSPVYTKEGLKHVWTTFSDDQIDLNFQNPQVLLEFVDIFCDYYQKGASYLRLDAIAYLWKKIGTSCINLRQTHLIVKLFRLIAEALHNPLYLITETNVPHQENISYFGDGDEAHFVYQFSLSPLILNSLYHGRGTELTEWAQSLKAPPKGTSFLNFGASHDGIGVRPLEGLVSENDIQSLLSGIHQFGGYVSYRQSLSGENSPYEINISLFDACRGTQHGKDNWQVQRFLCSQTIILSMQGIPALYIHSFLATPNDYKGVELTERTRSINRRQWSEEEIQTLLESPHSTNFVIYDHLKKLCLIRQKQEAFHPHAKQDVIDLGPSFFCIKRSSKNQNLILIANLSSEVQKTRWDKQEETDIRQAFDLIQNKEIDMKNLSLTPYQCLWIINQD